MWSEGLLLDAKCESSCMYGSIPSSEVTHENLHWRTSHYDTRLVWSRETGCERRTSVHNWNVFEFKLAIAHSPDLSDMDFMCANVVMHRIGSGYLHLIEWQDRTLDANAIVHYVCEKWTEVRQAKYYSSVRMLWLILNASLTHILTKVLSILSTCLSLCTRSSHQRQGQERTETWKKYINVFKKSLDLVGNLLPPDNQKLQTHFWVTRQQEYKNAQYLLKCHRESFGSFHIVFRHVHVQNMSQIYSGWKCVKRACSRKCCYGVPWD